MVLDELGGELRFVAASDAVGRKLATLHVELGEGPCLEAARTGERVLIADLGAADAVERFPHFAAKALAGGVSAVYSFPLRHLDQHVGSIGLFNATPAELDQMDLELAQLLADLTTASIVGAHRYQQVSGLAAGVRQHLADAAVLEQAKGGSASSSGYSPTVPSSICGGTSSPAAALPRGGRQVTAGDLGTTANPADEITRG